MSGWRFHFGNSQQENCTPSAQAGTSRRAFVAPAKYALLF
jgi:hypothetical protein